MKSCEKHPLWSGTQDDCAFCRSEPTSCPCTCHKPTHEARKPHPNCMAGR